MHDVRKVAYFDKPSGRRNKSHAKYAMPIRHYDKPDYFVYKTC